ncbi:MAG TPA: hypothetical protein VH419_17505 [Nocardioidaceae bacterium]
MSLSHRDVTPRADVDRAPGQGTSPPAQRLASRRWRDPRLWAGVLLVLVSVLAGAALLASSDDTVGVWAADADLHAGMSITPGDVHVVRVHFTDAASSDRYLDASHTIPDGAVLTRDVLAGELLAVAALDDGATEQDQLPLAVTPAGLPAGLAVGDKVDVWAMPAPETAADGAQASRQVLDGVVVTALGSPGPGGLESARNVLVGIPDRTDVGEVLDGLRGADVVLVRVGG